VKSALNGAAARQAVKGDLVIIITYASVEEQQLDGFEPKIVHVDAKNCISSLKRSVAAGTLLEAE